jgi:hypothetical protein
MRPCSIDDIYIDFFSQKFINQNTLFISFGPTLDGRDILACKAAGGLI